MSEQQREVVTRLLTAGNGIDAVIGVVGAGKSTLTDACPIAWEHVPVGGRRAGPAGRLREPLAHRRVLAAADRVRRRPDRHRRLGRRRGRDDR
ncbi:AAA family ATPase [Streptomyces sp. ISL-86]|uniref:AAA family ATPase n=1 Tax=Streptomyces sp. ISL-86 TaxID=2819187 RepID=UPI0035A85983